MPPPCGLFPPKTTVLGAAYGRKIVAIERIGLFVGMDDIQKSFNHLLGILGGDGEFMKNSIYTTWPLLLSVLLLSNRSVP
jgi:hypothetical protein